MDTQQENMIYHQYHSTQFDYHVTSIASNSSIVMHFCLSKWLCIHAVLDGFLKMYIVYCRGIGEDVQQHVLLL